MKNFLIPSMVLMMAAAPVWACDSCGCEFCEPGSLNGPFNAALKTGADSASPSYFFFNVVEQFTDFSTLKNVPAGVPTNQYEYSAITQFIVGYQFNQDLNVQLNLPYIYRSYQIPNLANTGMTTGQVNGLGDIRLIINYVAFRKEAADWDFSWRVSGGVKLPTGDPNLLNQESPNAAPSELNSPTTAVGGHDLALGSGSYDAVLSTGITLNWEQLLFTADTDYTIRGTGRAGYRYSNELAWSAGPGYRVWQNANYALTLQILASGEYKAADTVQDTITTDTFVSTVELGPNVLFAWNKVLTAHLQVEIPVMTHYDIGFQAIPTYRIKCGVAFRF